MDKMSMAMLKMDEYENSSCFLLGKDSYTQVIERVVVSFFLYFLMMSKGDTLMTRFLTFSYQLKPNQR